MYCFIFFVGSEANIHSQTFQTIHTFWVYLQNCNWIQFSSILGIFRSCCQCHFLFVFIVFFEGYAKVVLCSKGTGDKSNNIKKVATNKQTKKSPENYSTILIHWRED